MQFALYGEKDLGFGSMTLHGYASFFSFRDQEQSYERAD